MRRKILLTLSVVLLLSLSCSALQPPTPAPPLRPTQPPVRLAPATPTAPPTATAALPTPTLFIPTLTFAPDTPTPLPVSPTPAPPFIIVAPTPDGRSLAIVLAAAAHQAAALGLKPFAEFEAPW